jgi:hypothetical protein
MFSGNRGLVAYCMAVISSVARAQAFARFQIDGYAFTVAPVVFLL